MRPGPTLRQLLLAVNLVVALVPLGAIAGLRLIDSYLIRQTERRLIAESVLVAEAWRDHLLEERGIRPEESPEFRPAALREKRYAPIDPVLDARFGVLPPPPPPIRAFHVEDSPELRAGQRMGHLLQRAQVFNLSGARVLDRHGCVVASSRGELGYCFDHLPEVRRALAGHYEAVVRQRISDEPDPPLASIRRRGDLRVFTQTPVFMDGEVVGLVRMSRTAMSPEKLFWDDRNRILQLLLACLAIVPIASLGLSYAIARPVAAITRTAEAIANGEPRTRLAPSGLVPREVHTLSAALDRMTRQLTERAAYVTQFASHASHELKTPLSSIAGAVELLREQWPTMPEAQRERFLANVAEDTQRMQELVNGLLHLARIENAAEGEEREVQLHPFVASLCERAAPEGSATPILLDLSEAPETICIAPAHLETALANLLANAVRHGAGAAVEVRVAPDADADGVLFEVHDRGPGVPDALRDQIFERFVTTERDRGGTGLGLALVRAVAEARGGTVSCESGPLGTTFTLHL